MYKRMTAKMHYLPEPKPLFNFLCCLYCWKEQEIFLHTFRYLTFLKTSFLVQNVFQTLLTCVRNRLITNFLGIHHLLFTMNYYL